MLVLLPVFATCMSLAGKAEAFSIPCIERSALQGEATRRACEATRSAALPHGVTPSGCSLTCSGTLLAGAVFMAVARAVSSRRADKRGTLKAQKVVSSYAKSDIQVTAMTESEANAKGVENWPTWGSGVTKFDWQWSGTEEAYIIEGEATITPTGEWKECKEVTIKAGDFCVFPGGMTCIWDVTKKLNKHYNYP
eukprot:TRINITY_DN88290_c0_g1_i1.p1 TRINITY_DN88290_c0_g1~~TRINITY_DN88290_c0_g1_i1.p1  ORF type:complete len:194 (+),score=19.60 TRINITY_DN88290_c0_g1_i1:79-660(+)